MLIVGPSEQGKSTLAKNLVIQRNRVFDAKSRVCFWYYDTYESVPEEIRGRDDVILREGLPDMEELKKYEKHQAMIVIDDLMTKIDQNSGMERLVSVLAHHYDCFPTSHNFLLENYQKSMFTGKLYNSFQKQWG